MLPSEVVTEHHPVTESGYVRAEAEAFLRQCVAESRRSGIGPERQMAVIEEITATSTYRHTTNELVAGAKIAWRNVDRCVGKFYWKGLSVLDRRDLTTFDEIADALIDHLRRATNGGRIRLLISIFAQCGPGQRGIRIWNSQLVRYAGYLSASGQVVGDRATVQLTDLALRLGWTGAQGTPFDILPIIVQLPGAPPRIVDIPADAVLQVPLHHPEYRWFAELGLRWYAFPSISDQRLEIGGVSYPAAPFSAWYTGAEIGARNLGGLDRYDLLPVVADKMGLDTTSDRTLWKDRAMVELTAAVMHSFTEEGVTIIDHHVAANQFVEHEIREQRHQRTTSGRYDLLIPPLGGPATKLWGRQYHPTDIRPNFFSQDGWTDA